MYRRLAAACLVPMLALACSPDISTSVARDEAAFSRLAGSDQGGKLLATSLTGAAEVPGPGDPDGAGTARITVNVGQSTVCYELSVSGIAPATAAHIHEAPAGSAGGVVVGLRAPTNGNSSGCVSVARDLAKEIAANPSDYYVNVHNAAYPNGALRGQLN